MEVLKSSIHNCECVREVALIIQSVSNSYDSEVYEAGPLVAGFPG